MSVVNWKYYIPVQILWIFSANSIINPTDSIYSSSSSCSVHNQEILIGSELFL